MLQQISGVDPSKNSSAGDVSEQVARLEQFVGELKATVENVSAVAPKFNLNEATIRRMLKARRIREEQLGQDLFADPAWDILLEAYACELSQARVSISGLCGASSVPPTTALRWIRKLEEDGWLTRDADPFDGRRSWIALTASGSQRLTRYFKAVWSNLEIV